MKHNDGKQTTAHIELTQQGADLLLWKMLGQPGLRQVKESLYTQMPFLRRAPVHVQKQTSPKPQ